MPLLPIDDTVCHYRLEGRDDRPVLILAHSLGQDLGMWEPQVEDLTARLRVLRYDLRGHGASGVTGGDYSIEGLGRDVLALADGLGIARFAFCGLSIGGMIGQWLARHAPERVTAVVLANTSPRPDGPGMETRRRTVLASGMAAVADTVMQRFFSPATLAANPPAVATARHTLLTTDPVGYAGCCAAVRDMDQTAGLAGIRVPALVISGELDVSLPWQGHGEILAREIAGAQIVHLRAAHLSNLERPRSFTAALHRFLSDAGVIETSGDTRARGLEVRRAVLGDAHVDRALASAVSDDFQDLITRYAWGTIWTRPGLDRRTRRLFVLAISAALGRWEEFRLHVRTGLAGDLEWCELEEVLLQVAVYAGVPAANTGFHIAAEEREPKA